MNRLWWIAITVLFFTSIYLRSAPIFLLSLLLAMLALVSLLWTKYCLVNVDYQRRFDAKRLFFGDETEVHIEITNAKLLPLAWLRVDDEYPAALQLVTDEPSRGYMPGRRRLSSSVSLRPYERVTRRQRVRGIRRGVWSFGPTQLRSGDLFGFDIRRLTLDNIEDVVVYPRMVPVRGLTLPSRHPLGDARSRQRIMTDPLRIMGVREYAEGDSFRHVHWKATARRQSLQTKVFEPSSTQPVAIFLNVSTFDHFGYGHDWALAEYAITTAASIARQVSDEGHALGLYANALLARGGQRIRIRPRKHPAQLVRLLEALAQIDGRGRPSLAQLLQGEAMRLPYGTTVVIISPLMDRSLHLTLLDLQRKGYGITLILLGNAKTGGPLPGVQVFSIGGHEEWETLEELRFE